MSDEIDKERLRRSLQNMSAAPVPDFHRTFAAAERRVRNKKRRVAVAGLVATAVVMGVVAMMRTPGKALDDYGSADALMATTYWTAPSDALLPQPEIDIYQDLPVLIESTDFSEGALL